jgi:hypothetical protein
MPAALTEADLLAGIRTAAEHRGGVRCLQLFRMTEPVFARLAGDVEQLCRDERPSEVGLAGHVTYWTRPFGEVLQFSLLNRSGRFDDFTTDHDRSCIGKTFGAAARYPALAAFVASLPHAVNVRINVLGPRSGLSPHEEHVLIRTGATIGARVRFHLPITTSSAAELMLDGDIYRLARGTLYFINHGCVHAAANHGDAPRIHLAWDQLLTRDVFDVMFGARGLPDGERLAEWIPAPVRRERVGAYERIAPDVTRAEAMRLALCEPQ